MPVFSRRRILSKQMQIFRATGKPMLLYVRTTPIEPTVPDVPANLFTAFEEPSGEVGEFTVKGFFGKFIEFDKETREAGGRLLTIKGICSIPYLWRTLLAQADYIDPYCDGSRFAKIGSPKIDQLRLIIEQEIQSVFLPSSSELK